MSKTFLSSEQAVKCLEDAKSYINRGWCQGHAAENHEGMAVDPTHLDACKWCASGAVKKSIGGFVERTGATFDAYLSMPNILINVLSDNAPKLHTSEESVPTGHLNDYNDHKDTTKADVIRLFEHTIKALRSGGTFPPRDFKEVQPRTGRKERTPFGKTRR